MIKSIFRYVPVSVLLIMHLHSGGAAQIYLSGPISGDIPAGSYIIKNNIVVLPGKNLLIHPGVELRFADSASFDVYGSVRAFGSSSDPINFSSVGTAQWKGLRIYQGAGQIFLQSVLIANCSGILVSDNRDSLRLDIQRCIFKNCKSAVSGTHGISFLEATGKPMTFSCAYPGNCDCLKGFEPFHTSSKFESLGIPKSKLSTNKNKSEQKISRQVMVVVLGAVAIVFGVQMIFDVHDR